MPSNMRPGRYIDPIRKNQSIAEIEDAQNTWDLLNEQEKANKLAQENINIQQQKIEEERENAERIANATKQAEKERQMHEKDIEITRQEHENIMRYTRLCDDFGVDYDDMCNLELLLNYNSDKTNKMYEDFYNFRREHFSRETEILFRQLKLNLGNITSSEIISNGSKEDYINYIYDIIMDNAELIEEIKEGATYDADPLLEEVIGYVIEKQEVSEDDLQKRFKIPLERIEKLILQMEERAIIMNWGDLKPIEVLWTKEKWQELMNLK